MKRKVLSILALLLTAVTQGAWAQTGMTNGLFSVSATKRAYFSKGNLQLVGENTFQFAENQWDYFGSNQSDNHRDLFSWGTGNNPNQTTGNSTFTDWGDNTYLQATLGKGWRTMTKDEFVYVFNTRASGSSVFGNANGRYTTATINTDDTGVNGFILFPDGITIAASEVTTAGTINNKGTVTQCTKAQWAALAEKGCVFLPAAGYFLPAGGAGYGNITDYWSSTAADASKAYNLNFNFGYPQGGVNPASSLGYNYGCSVRLVIDGITLDKNEAQMTIGNAMTLTATVVTPTGDKTVTWTTSDASVATVADGVVTAVAAGTATITATATNGTADTGDDVSATCAVTVNPPTKPGLPVVNGKFSVSDTKQVYFSKGNLQYDGTNWKFAASQWEVLGANGTGATGTATNYPMDFFTWGNIDSPTYNGTTYYTENADLSGITDWGSRMGSGWYTLSKDELLYLFGMESNNTDKSGHARYRKYFRAKVNGLPGIVVLPDDLSGISDIPAESSRGTASNFNGKTYTTDAWSAMESAGCVFLPTAGFRKTDASVSHVGWSGFYWASTAYGAGKAYTVGFDSYSVDPANNFDRTFGFAVRLVIDGITLDKNEAQMTIGNAMTLTATVVTPTGDKTVTWTTSDASVATVADGVVTAVAAGTATITATATNGTADTGDDVSATCQITVSGLSTDESGAYLIASSDNWDTFAYEVNNGINFSGQVVKLTEDISVSTMAGTDHDTNAFRGTFEGGDHTLTINVSNQARFAAPFKGVNGATIKDLKTTGSISGTGNNDGKLLGGIVGVSRGSTTITNCVSSVTITTAYGNDAALGGLVGATRGGSVTISGCVFNGKMTGASNTRCAGFTGYEYIATTTTISNSLFAPSELTVYTVDDGWGKTFSRDGNATIINCYYTQALGRAQGALAVELDTAPDDLGDLVTDYGMVKVYDCCILFDGKYYVATPVVTIDEQKYPTLYDAISAVTNGQTMKLVADIKELATYNKSGVTATLDLNGHTIDGDKKGTVLTIQNGTFILDDSSEDKAGTITGGYNMSADGGGVAVTGGAFTMKGGTIEGNISRNGGGVSYTGGTFNMLGGAIQYNEGSQNTGGVLVTANAFTMSGGTIQYNVGKNFGGVGIASVQPSFSRTAMVKDNVIFSNTSGKITKTETGYALTEGGTPCDVKHATANGLALKVVGELQSGAQIGIFNNSQTNAFTTGYNTYNASSDAQAFFFSNDPNKEVIKDSNGELIFSTPALALAENVDNSTALSEANGLVRNVTLTRTLATGSWNTFAAPFSTAIPEGWTVKELSSSSLADGVLTLNFANATSIEAGKPYLVKVAANTDLSTAPFTGAIVSKELHPVTSTYIDFIPTLGKTTIGSEGDDPTNVLFIATGNKLKNPSEMPAYMKGFRGYFQLKNVNNARSFVLNFGSDETTGISEVRGKMEDVRGVYYDLQGRRVGSAKKGVYIVNGKKVIK